MTDEDLSVCTASHLELIPQAAHLSNIENPDGFHAAVGRF